MAINNENIDTIIDEIKKYEMKKKELEEKINANKKCVKIIMNEEGVDEIRTEKYIVRNKEVTSNRFDTTRFKKDHKDLYEAYTVTSTSERFTIN